MATQNRWKTASRNQDDGTPKPLKGAHLALTEEVLQFLIDQLHVVQEHYTDDLHDNTPLKVLDALVSVGWESESDDYGNKAFIRMPWQDGFIRVTVVHKPKGDALSLDIREWGKYKSYGDRNGR